MIMDKPDTAVVTALVTAPVWVIPITQINEYLTALSLLTAVGVALVRTYFWWKDRRINNANND